MITESIKLINYRNYKTFELSLSNTLNIFVGNNAQGKTNILEAIYYISAGNSHRTNKDNELILWEHDFFKIFLDIFRNNRKFNIEINYNKEGKRKIFINGVEKKKKSDLLGLLNVVIFSPEDLVLVKGSPIQRRKFIDNEISQVNKNYYHLLQQYNKVLYQRNILLKQIRERKQKEEQLLVWDIQLSSIGSKIIKKRLEVLRKINPLAKLAHRKITSGIENLEIKYISENNYPDDQGEIEGILNKQLTEKRKEEIIRGISLVGPHRDDLKFIVNNVDIKIFGSQGQQRTTALSLKLAEIEFMKSEIGEYPILLLDDVMSELDNQRREYLIETIQNKIQTFITTTNLNFINLDKMKDSLIIRINKGQIIDKE